MVASTYTPQRRTPPSVFNTNYTMGRHPSRSPSPPQRTRGFGQHPATVKPRNVFKRLTPKHSRPTSAPSSPTKREALGMASRSDLNSRMKSPSPSNRLMLKPPRGDMMDEDVPVEKFIPLKRSDGIMNLNQVSSSGSPVAKRRSTQGAFGMYSPVSPTSTPTPHAPQQPVFGTPSLPFQTPRRLPSSKKGLATNHGDKPSFARARPQARYPEFATPADPASRIRKMQSVDGFLPHIPRGSPFTLGPLPSASEHNNSNDNNPLGFQNAPTPHPFSRSAGPLSRPSMRHSLGGVETNPLAADNWTTPQNYKFAKPNQAAFHSTGFVPKRGRKLSTDSVPVHQPETPCKRPTTISNIKSKPNPFSFASPKSPFGSGNVFGRLQRSDSVASFEDINSPGNELDLPPTPTKRVYGSNIGGLFGLKRNRSENNCEKDGLDELDETDIETATPVFDRIRTGSPTKGGPKTPKEIFAPPDPSSLSISGKKTTNFINTSIPSTPSKDYLDFLRPTKTPFRRSPGLDKSPKKKEDACLHSRFSQVKLVGTGEFSEVYMVTEAPTKSFQSTPFSTAPNTPSHNFSTPTFGRMTAPPSDGRTFAVKKFKQQYHGVRERERYMEEVNILKALGKHDHVIEYMDSWEENRTIYIQTEYCENGSLDTFLDELGNKGRLDEFRVWKIMLELAMGLQHIHESGFIHLDIKPANVLIAFDGSLKISDFGMSTRWPAAQSLEREGDRQYIAPEALQSHIYDRPGDIFSLGLSMIEIAGNEALPPNGPEWQSLRQGDLSVAPALSTSRSGELVIRDDEGNPIATELISDVDSAYASSSFSSNISLDEELAFGTSSSTHPDPFSPFTARRSSDTKRVSQSSSNQLLHKPRSGDLQFPPKFMEEGGLERIIGRMINANPRVRPTAAEIVNMEELRWVDNRRRAAATIFEGLWGPADEDTRMEDDADEDWRMEM